MVAAADDERRRVVRDLHDGAQQRLVHTVITLKLARRALENEDGTVPELVAEALEQAEEATDELRELAHGILPSILTARRVAARRSRRWRRGCRSRSRSTCRPAGSLPRSRRPPTSSSPRR